MALEMLHLSGLFRRECQIQKHRKIPEDQALKAFPGEREKSLYDNVSFYPEDN
jgi:hypothetical protein